MLTLQVIFRWLISFTELNKRILRFYLNLNRKQQMTMKIKNYQEELKHHLKLALETLENSKDLLPEEKLHKISLVYSKIKFAALNAKCAMNILYKTN